MAETDSKWSGRTFGSGAMHRALIAVLRWMPLWMLYTFAYTVVLPTVIPTQWRSLRLIYRLARATGRSRLRSAFVAVANLYCFAGVVIDRFAMYAGKRYKIEVEGNSVFEQAMADESKGTVILSSHLGNFELAGYSMFSSRKHFNAVVFGLEKSTIMEQRQVMLGRNNMELVLANETMEHVFKINSALENHEVVAIPADRLFGSSKFYAFPFLGGEWHFPKGAFAVAVMKPANILQLTVLKKSLKTYSVIVEQLNADPSLSASQRAHEIATQFAGNLERAVTRHPSQWFNYFDFSTQSPRQ